MSYAWLNIGSLLLGLVGWMIPIISLIKGKKKNSQNIPSLTLLSMAAVILSLWFQILYSYYLLLASDWSALLDTTGTMVIVALLLIVGTFLLNILNIFQSRETKK